MLRFTYGRTLLAGLLTTLGTSLLPARAQTASPPTWQWATALNASQGLWGRSVARDAAGNLYVTGWYRGACTLGGTALPAITGSNTPSTLPDYGGYLVKLNAAGVVQWAQSFNGPEADGGFRVAADASGNVYLTGRLSGPQTIGSSSLPGVANGSNYVFLAKFDTNGAAQWAVQGQPTGRLDDSWHITAGLAVDAAGNVYAALNGITKYSPAGTVLWNTPVTSGQVTGLSVGQQGQVLASGYFSSPATLGTGAGAVTLTAPTSYAGGGLTAQLSGQGAVQWAQAAGGSNSSGTYAVDASADAAGNVYVMGCGGFGYVQLGTVALSSVTTYLARYSATGSLAWAKDVSTNLVYARAMVADPSGTTYVSATGSLEAYTSAGNLFWRRTDGLERMFGLVVAGTDLYSAGNYGSSGGMAGTLALPASGGLGGYAGRLGGLPLATSRPAQVAGWAVYPNPSAGRRVQLAAAVPLPGPVELSLCNVLGQQLKAATVPTVTGNWHHEWDLTGVASGLYTVQLRTAAGTTIHRLVLE